MDSFGEAFRKARVSKRATLREIAEHIGKSIGYLSDVEHGRKRPPKLDLVTEIEDFLEVEDGKLLKLAAKARKKIPMEVTQRFRTAPRLSEALLRADLDFDLTDEEFDEVINHVRRIRKRRKS